MFSLGLFQVHLLLWFLVFCVCPKRSLSWSLPSCLCVRILGARTPLCFCSLLHTWSVRHVLLIFDVWDPFFFLFEKLHFENIFFCFWSLSSSSTGAFVSCVVPRAVVCGVVLKNWFYVNFFQFPGDFCWPGVVFYIHFMVWGSQTM